ncbi:DUF2059 domain-containing protein [Lysobacter sp. GX 14042]|uniref:DUF2059 domain-containing protein n=1 Tax=Lysobacter sp. GX 14042 TaxID=2907155 RepID=UPI001F28D31A|nr:DUF2059 domain-containing protein [Lysobacter sp. GX 14042]MCE7032245.1 DUF2059 domain-containing protein [Lysobacter sp. GX 14042]
MRGLGLLLAGALALGAATSAHAAEPAAADVDRLMDAMRMQQSLDAMWPQIGAMQARMIDQLYEGEPDAEAEAEFRAAAERSTARLRDAMSWDKVRPLYREIYQQTFDAADVQAMTEFYASPTGQRVLDKTPQLMANTMAAAQQLMMPLLQEMERDLQATAAALEEGDRAP